ncbi:hypothetical protein yc1106_07878 [Curvularia clavata]|uniref:Uncharacterized protein n=1 Tax=Curvularia clavata TaxID=95742 RepID=A0A9Q9DW75_CURCL|nr:hypothetical protein yc1106_07878 [Curvularia clavata]
MANTFYGSWNANNAIPAPQCMAGGIMNFNFGSDRPGNDGTRSHRQLEPFSTVPFPPDPDFVDRPEILGWLHKMCVGNGNRAALVGFGGVGKSQLAIQFAHSIHDASPQTFVFWVHASSRTQFEKAYREIADRLQLPDRNDPNKNVLMLVSNWLRDKANGQWFMVLDNVDQEDIFSSPRKRRLDEANADAQTSLDIYLPQSRNGSILVTSRNRDAAVELVGSNRIKEVLAMDKKEGLQLLRKKLCQPPSKESAVKLLFTLGHVPLAITQASAYINRRVRMSITEYLDGFHRDNKERERLLSWDSSDLRRDKSASNSILTTWQMSFEQIRHERPSAAELLSLMSFFNSRGIPDWILRKSRKKSAGAAARRNSRNEGEDEDVDSELNEDLDILRAYSLISATAENDSYEMHPLVQFCMRAWLSSFGEVDRWHHEFVVLMDQELCPPSHDNLVRFSQLFPHIEPVFNSTPSKETLRAWARVLCGTAVYVSRKGRFTTAQHVVEKALSVTENALGFNDDFTLGIAAVLMHILVWLDLLHEAEEIGQRVLQGYQELGKQDLFTFCVAKELAKIMREQGRYEESKKLVQQITESHKEERNPFILGNQAGILKDLGQLEEAEKLFRQAMERCKEQLGEHHADMLWLTSSLARVLSKQGRWLEAETFLRQTLEVSKERLGERHPETLENILFLAKALEHQGQFVEAEKLFWQAIEGFGELAEDDFRTLFAMDELATMLIAQERYEEAVQLVRQAREVYRNIDEPGVPTTRCAKFLAYLLLDLNQHTEAMELYQQVYSGYMSCCGPENPQTIKCYEDLATLQQQMQQAGSDEVTVSV